MEKQWQLSALKRKKKKKIFFLLETSHDVV